MYTSVHIEKFIEGSMKVKKILTGLILICISIFTFFGCANIEYYRAVDGTGAIIDRLVVTLDSKKIKSANLNYSVIEDNVKSDLTKFMNHVENWKDTAFEDYPDIEMMVSEGIEISRDDLPEEGKFSITLRFSSWTIFGLFYGITNMEGGEYEGVMSDVGPFISEIIDENYLSENLNLFLYKYSKLNSTGILKGIKDFSVADLGNYYNKYTNITGLDLDSINVSQSFVYPDDRIYSNADIEESVGGLTFLNWNLSDKDEDFEMSIFKLAPRGISWYILALIISAIVVVVLIVVFKFKSNGKDEEKITRREVENNGK